MTVEQKRAALRRHPDTVTLEIDGTEYHWSFGRWGLRLAKKAGLDVDGLLALMDGAAPAGAEALERSMDLIAVGMLPFHDEADEVLDVLDCVPLKQVSDIADRLMASLSDGAPEADDEDGPEGNAPAEGPSRA